MHDEISGWVSTEGEEKPGVLESRWLTFDDEKSETTWIDEKGQEHTARKGGNIKITEIQANPHYNLLPEFYLRKSVPDYISIDELDKEINNLKEMFKKLGDLYD